MVKLVCFIVEMNELECFVSLIEPKTLQEALNDEFWTESMHLELEQFDRLQVWELVPRPDGVNIIGTKWIHKNKTDENGNVAETNPDLWEKATHKSKVWTLMRHLPQLHD